MKIKSSLFGAGLGIAALLLTACGANNDPLAESSALWLEVPNVDDQAAAAPLVQQYGLSQTPLSSRLTDQYLPHSMRGFKDVRIYPLDHADLRRARALAKGHTRDGKVLL